MQNVLEEARKIKDKLLDVWERKKDKTIKAHLSKKDQEDAQRTKNFRRSQEDDENTIRADKEVKRRGFL